MISRDVSPTRSRFASSPLTQPIVFIGRVEGVLDPERKRKIIGEEFIRVFEEEASKFGGSAYSRAGHNLPRRH